MEKKNYLTLNKQNQKDLTDYCKLNNIEDVDKFFQKCFKRGYDIERYGLIGNTSEPEKIVEYVEKEVPIEVVKYIEKETIREVPVEVIKEVEKEVINTVYVEKEVPIEKIVEIIKEIPVYVSGDTQIIEKIIEIPIEVIKEVEVVKEIDKSNEKMGMLQETLMKLRREIGDKDKTITELNNKIEQLEKLVSNTGAVYMKGSNLSQNL